MQLWGLWIFLVVLAAAMVVLMWYVGESSRRREREILASRSSDTLESLVASFRPELQPVASVMYTKLQEFTFSRKFPLRKSDVLVKTLNIGGTDLDEALTKVGDQFGCRKPTDEDDTRFKGRKTFEDYVEFINHLKTS